MQLRLRRPRLSSYAFLSRVILDTTPRNKAKTFNELRAIVRNIISQQNHEMDLYLIIF